MATACPCQSALVLRPAVVLIAGLLLALGGCGEDDTTTVPRGAESTDRRSPDRAAAREEADPSDRNANAADAQSQADAAESEREDADATGMSADLPPLVGPGVGRGAASPNALLTRLADGMLAGEVEPVFACLIDPGPPLHRWAEVFEAAAALCHAQAELRKAVLDRFGVYRAISFDSTFAVPAIADPARYEVMRHRRLELEEGDEVRFPPGFSEPFTLIRREEDGHWLLDPAAALEAAERRGRNPNALAERLRTLTEHRREAHERIADAADFNAYLESTEHLREGR